MKNRLHRVAKAAEPVKKSVDWHDFRNIPLGDIPPFVSGAETIDNDEVRTTFFAQARGENRTDEPRLRR